jgi:hypothetical protein
LISKLSKKLAMRESKENAIAYPTAQITHISTYPMKLAQKALEKKPTQESKEPCEGGPGSGPSGSEHQADKPAQPKVLAHWTYDGERYKAGVRYPKSQKPKKTEADSASSNVPVLRVGGHEK